MCWHALLLIACALVFTFALHAKLAVYGQTSQPHPSTSSKLWIGGAKWPPPSAAPVPTMLWLAAAFITCLPGWQDVRRYQAAHVVVVREQRRRQYLHRLLRPPPQR